MPRETIWTVLPRSDSEKKLYGDDGDLKTESIAVAWGIDTFVTIGVQFDHGKPEGETGHWTTIDRTGINKLIKHLRKARDQAYGADE